MSRSRYVFLPTYCNDCPDDGPIYSIRVPEIAVFAGCTASICRYGVTLWALSCSRDFVCLVE
ncbi:hypothetical protein C8Q76DRAFT_758923 [Earliella scabrosa]|nr:hypothetical protein C8Q76DRAFT_758923 [Earliella scabrosa]